MDKQFNIWCCNPFDRQGHSTARKGLRSVTELMVLKVPGLIVGSKICADCRLKIYSMSDVHGVSSVSSEEEVILNPASPIAGTSGHQHAASAEYEKSYIVSQLNPGLVAIGTSPISARKLEDPNYINIKKQKVSDALERTLGTPTLISEDPEIMKENSTHFEELISQLKEKFNSTDDRSLRVQILTLLPLTWSRTKIVAEFGATDRMVRMAKELVVKSGVMSSPRFMKK